MDWSAHKKADVEDGFPHGAPALHQPAVLRVLLRTFLVRVLAHHAGQQLGVLELEGEGLLAQPQDLRELLPRPSVPVPQTGLPGKQENE